METVVAVEENVEIEFEGTSATVRTSFDSSKQIADPIVYKLVRVEGDGRLVPATDHEVMEVEDLLDEDKSLMNFVLDTGQTANCTSNDETSSGKIISINCEGFLKFEDPSIEGERSNAVVGTTADLGELNSQFEEISPSESTLNGVQLDQSGDRMQADPPIGSAENQPSSSTVCASLKPEFSKLKGEICLDDLSVRELHATFKATFGRETSVKDKQWLKRRIAMGLSNSCDVATTTFIIANNRVKKKGEVEDCKIKDGNSTEDTVAGLGGVNGSCDRISVGHTNQVEDHFRGSSKSVQSAMPKHRIDSEDCHQGQRSAKRVRKPTKRYIEEVSELDFRSREYSGKLVSSVQNSGRGKLSPRTRVRPIHNIQPVRRPLVTRQDSLGGSEVEIPYVFRIRRGRPRENFMALMEFQSCGMGMAARLVKKAFDGHGPQSDNKIENKERKARPAHGWVQRPLIKEPGENARSLEQSTELNNGVDAGYIDSYADDSDDNITVPTAKGGMRRKHHRPWTPKEVVKLVEGVSRYGAGRWSEIKRIAFATYSHRTSVDLKDKWRNLLRASFAQLPAEKGVQQNSRKQSSIPIPAPILLRVRELAEMQSQVTPDLSSMKFGTHCGSRSVNDISSGFL